MSLRTYLTDIADAIREKKGTSDPINAQDFASEIASISTGGGGTGDNPLQTLVTGRGIYGGYYLFYKYNGPADLISTLDFSLITDASYMFSKISNQLIPHLTNLNNVTNANYMFSQAAALRNIEAFNTSSITNMQAMFEQCTSLESLFPINSNAATTMRFMFSSCYRLKTIDITKLAAECGYFASSCYSLTKCIIRTMDTLPTFGSSMFNSCYHFTGKHNSSYNPDGLQDGRIYVPDAQVDALKAATGWSEFADVIVPLSTLVED